MESLTHMFFLLTSAAVLQSCFCYETCKIVGNYEYYCEDGYHCCNGDTDCCLGEKSSDNTSLQAWVIPVIVIGSVSGLVIIGCIIKHLCQRHNKMKLAVAPGTYTHGTEISYYTNNMPPAYNTVTTGDHEHTMPPVAPVTSADNIVTISDHKYDMHLVAPVTSTDNIVTISDHKYNMPLVAPVTPADTTVTTGSHEYSISPVTPVSPGNSTVITVDHK